eukprot:CAMPEP_0184494714 /NCGR_PEP_ID=MMETSP0113_2-20130426/29416_1 /TAXON_ID=91329 /ORGANISM="Norrisiella sphaerica, Strain BC52" /LENGTH=141 /DNA_ID=CAMNT_0026880577 /DNA_START=112 /DNA_END=534 /DNA_ORIENTATION=+
MKQESLASLRKTFARSFETLRKKVTKLEADLTELETDLTQQKKQQTKWEDKLFVYSENLEKKKLSESAYDKLIANAQNQINRKKEEIHDIERKIDKKAFEIAQLEQKINQKMEEEDENKRDQELEGTDQVIQKAKKHFKKN